MILRRLKIAETAAYRGRSIITTSGNAGRTLFLPAGTLRICAILFPAIGGMLDRVTLATVAVRVPVQPTHGNGESRIASLHTLAAAAALVLVHNIMGRGPAACW